MWSIIYIYTITHNPGLGAAAMISGQLYQYGGGRGHESVWAPSKVSGSGVRGSPFSASFVPFLIAWFRFSGFSLWEDWMLLECNKGFFFCFFLNLFPFSLSIHLFKY
ncbi:hypothetical protein GDO81_014549 [Engystomops pustulosus]|uniref:Uncharacterized protein n=1 Tax=Engystomops pustulosus TaxID=76066 RepID=A0AAV7BB62_ENGPU|nr:hypothetical protein GDO81_014549 [Engystomops pustulosus]